MKRFSNREILKITLPVLVSLLMEQLVGLTDTVYLGHYGDGRTELAASALAGVFYLVVFMLGFGFSVGAQVLIARRNGEGRPTEIGPLFMQGVLFLLVLAGVLFALSRLFSEGLFTLLVEQPAVRRAAPPSTTSTGASTASSSRSLRRCSAPSMWVRPARGFSPPTRW